MIAEVVAGLFGRWSQWASSAISKIGVEFASPGYYYELFGKEAAEEWLPTVDRLYGVMGLFYLAVLIYVFYRFRYLAQLRHGWAESRRRRSWAKAAKAERLKKLKAAEAEAAGVSYEAFQALRRANRAFDDGRYAEALVAYEEAGRATPPLSAAWVGRGAALGRLGRHEEAREAFGRALELNPANAEARVNLGLVALATGDIDSAGGAFARSVEMDGACARGHFGLAVVAAGGGAKADLLAHLKLALRLSPALLDSAAREPAFAPLADDACFTALLARFSPPAAKARRAG